MEPPLRLVVIGNSGSGKSTLAKRLASSRALAHLDLDVLAWLPSKPPRRRPLAESATDIAAFVARHDAWIVEGCYADLAALVLPSCTRLLFLNPGVDACLENARARPWEPHKYATREEQDANLAMLLDWIRAYWTRDDVCSLRGHRTLYDAHVGEKEELSSRAAIAALGVD